MMKYPENCARKMFIRAYNVVSREYLRIFCHKDFKRNIEKSKFFFSYNSENIKTLYFSKKKEKISPPY